MSKTIYLTEEQLVRLLLLNQQPLNESTKQFLNENILKAQIKTLLKKGIAVSAIVTALVTSYNFGYNNALEYVKKVGTEMNKDTNGIINQQDTTWTLLCNDVIATVYNAEPRQCNIDISHTASMFRLNLFDVLSHKIIAMERTMMAEYGLKYGDVVKIEGTGKWDGVWQIQDTMNKRFAGQHKIDILIPKSEGLGQWKNIKIYGLTNPEERDSFKNTMAPQLTKQQSKEQLKKIKNNKRKKT